MRNLMVMSEPVMRVAVSDGTRRKHECHGQTQDCCEISHQLLHSKKLLLLQGDGYKLAVFTDRT